MFGIDEFLSTCMIIGSEPVITVNYYAGPDEAADLVEYVNTPNDGTNPRGGMDWAGVRAKNGHPEPYGIRFFEIGNEVMHGFHDGPLTKEAKPVSAVIYARDFLRFSQLMRQVNSSILIGVVGGEEQWNKKILEIAGREVDFVIAHTYFPGSFDPSKEKFSSRDFFKYLLASPPRISAHYKRLLDLIDISSGRPGKVGIAVTEYNCSYSFNQPLPYRHTLGNALHIADLLSVMIELENRIVMANFWQFINEHWGAVSGPVEPFTQGPLVRRPQYYPFQMYADFFQPVLLKTEVRSPSYRTGEFKKLAPSFGSAYVEKKVISDNLLRGRSWKLHPLKNVSHRVNEDELVIKFNSQPDQNYYHAWIEVVVKPKTHYLLKGEIKTEKIFGPAGVALEIINSDESSTLTSTLFTGRLSGSNDYTNVQCAYFTLPDCNKIKIRARRTRGGGGTARIKNVELYEIIPESFPAVPYLSVNASRSDDGKMVCLMVVNKHPDSPLFSEVDIPGFDYQEAVEIHTLNGPSLEATNEINPGNVGITSRQIQAQNKLIIGFPPHSFSAVIFKSKQSGISAE